MELDPDRNCIPKPQGSEEMHGLLANSMQGKQMYVLFFSRGPLNSEFSIPCVQLTDSCYVCHSEYILYRYAYDYFKQSAAKQEQPEFFKVVHSAGELDENKVSKNSDKKRIYIDLLDHTVYSVTTSMPATVLL